jgi:hypothetical protein
VFLFDGESYCAQFAALTEGRAALSACRMGNAQGACLLEATMPMVKLKPNGKEGGNTEQIFSIVK